MQSYINKILNIAKIDILNAQSNVLKSNLINDNFKKKYPDMFEKIGEAGINYNNSVAESDNR
jgi:hypothetical protein